MNRTEDQAKAGAATLLKKLGGEDTGWKTYIHENLGWFYRAYWGEPVTSHDFGLIEITAPYNEGDDSWTLWVQISPQIILQGDDPIRLLAKARLALKDRINQELDLIEKLKKARTALAEALVA